MRLAYGDIGYYGEVTTLDVVKKRFIIPRKLWKKAKQILRAYIPCQLFIRRATTNTILHPYNTQPTFSFWGIDWIGPLINSNNDNTYLLTIIDYATGKALACAHTNRSTTAVIELVEEIVWTYGAPQRILSDNGAEFRSDRYLAALKHYNIEAKRTTPGHPQTNGKVERLNHEITQRLQRLTVNDHDNWDLYVRQALFAYHTHTNKRMGCSPSYLQYSVELDSQLRQATIDHLHAQKSGGDVPAAMQQLARLAKDKKQLASALSASASAEAPVTATPVESPSKRIRRLPWKLRED